MPEPLSAKSGLGIKVTVLLFLLATFFEDVLEPHELVAHLDQGLEFHVDFRLSGRGHLMVLRLYFHTELFQNQDHLGAQVLLAVGGRNREIAFFVAGLIAQVGIFFPSGVPNPFDRIDLIKSEVGAPVVADVIEDKKFGFRSEEGRIGQAGKLQVVFSLMGDISRVPAISLFGYRDRPRCRSGSWWGRP